MTPVAEPTSGGDIDLFSSLSYRVGRPHAAWRRLRDEEPVALHRAADGTEFWSVTRYADVATVLRDTQTFSSEHSTMLDVIGGDPATGRAINLMDAPRHRPMKTICLHTMSPAVVSDGQELLRRRLRLLVDSLPCGEEVDFVAATMLLPMITSGALLGIPPAEWREAIHWSMVSIAPADPVYACGAEEDSLRIAHMQLFDLCSRLVDERRRNPGNDFVSVLLAHEIDGTPLTEQEVAVNFYAAIMGANITTAQVVSHVVCLATEQPELWSTLRADRSLLPSAVDEALRWASPINHLLRKATADTEIGGVRIRAGELVCSWLASANRDERAFPRPFEFDPSRSPNRHVAFGIGPHYCIGAFAARAGITTLLDELLDAVEAFDSAGPPAHLQSNFINGITRLPVVAHAAPERKALASARAGTA